jgi:hemerythrin-like domain-containing protein
MTTTIPLLNAQHQEVLARLAAVEADLQTGGDHELGAFGAYLELEVMQHFTLEEQALFPPLARHLSMTQGPLAVMNAEHAEFRELLQGLTAAVRAGAYADQRAHAGEIIELLRAHIHKEDHVLFPMAEQLLSAEELAEVDRQASALDRAAPSPHA